MNCQWETINYQQFDWIEYNQQYTDTFKVYVAVIETELYAVC